MLSTHAVKYEVVIYTFENGELATGINC